MTNAATETETHGRWPLPANTQEVLQLILEHGNVSYTDAEGNQVAGHWNKPGPILPSATNDFLAIAMNGLLSGGPLAMMVTTRAGRHYAKVGTMAGFDDVTDLDLRAWGRGDIEYDLDELLEAVEVFHHELALTRGEALVVLLKKGVITPAEARRDV